ncbi:MAG: SLC26A/SulP transporter family protein [Planctomycetes bacterium]|nr:SLC26A/SulP transporter family protein [Planctomycetota bacterium]
MPISAAPEAMVKKPPSLSGDIWGGIAAMLVALPSAIAFGVLTYTVLGPQYAGAGAMAGLLGAAALGLVAPAVGRTNGLISAPCAPAAAVLTALIAGLLDTKSGPGLPPDRIPALLIVTALLAGALQVLYGALGGGRLIKFIPYPVVCGYLSGVGVLIALGQLPKLFGMPAGTPLFEGLITPRLWQWESLAVGLVTIGLMLLAPRITKKIPAAIVGLLGGIAAYFALSLHSPALLTLQNNPLVIGPLEATGAGLGNFVSRMGEFARLDVDSLKFIVLPAITLSVLLSIDTLKTCVGLDTRTRTRHVSDRELVGQGLGNLVSALIGGMPGAGTMGPTLVNVTSGGRTARAGLIEGATVVLALLVLSPLVAWVPIGALAGILLVVAFRMFDRGMFRLLWRPAGRLDFAVIAAVVLVSIAADLIAAAGVGVALAILLFIMEQIRGSVIRRKLYLNETSSKTHRLPQERKILKEHGSEGVFCELQGNLFFGTTDQLYALLERDLSAKRYILFDLRRVRSMDYTAAHLFEQMNAQLEEHGGQLLLSGMPSSLIEQRDFEHYLTELGVAKTREGVLISETMDGALEWMEDRILEAAGVSMQAETGLLALKDFHVFAGLDETTLAHLAACATERAFAPGARVFSQGDPGEEIFLVRRGSVQILLPLEGGKRHHLNTFGRGDFFGELAFLDRGKRSADAEAKEPTDLFVLSRGLFNKQCEANSRLAAQFFERLAATVSERLRQTDSELRILADH